MERLLGLRILPIVNETTTVATQEIRFGDNDRPPRWCRCSCTPTARAAVDIDAPLYASAVGAGGAPHRFSPVRG